MNERKPDQNLSINPEGNKRKLPYKVPEKIASATIHFLYGISERGKFKSVNDYLKVNKYALTADLIQEGFKPEQIEEAVNSGSVKVAPVFNKRISDFYWTTEAEKELDELSVKIQYQCGGDGSDGNAPVGGGDIVSIGGLLGSQQMALAGIAYAASKGLVLETDIDRGMSVGNMFVSKDSPLAFMVAPKSKGI